MFCAIMVAPALNAIVMVFADRQVSSVLLFVIETFLAYRTPRMLLESGKVILELLLSGIEDIAIPANIVTSSEVIL